VPLEEITVILNLPSELYHLKNVQRQREERTTTPRSPDLPGAAIPTGEADKSKGISEATVRTDILNIELADLTFQYSNYAPILNCVNFTFPQGKMVAITGPHQSGKMTFIKLLANILIPTSGSIFIPAYLRVLHVSRHPLFLRASMLHNLAMGLPQHSNLMKKLPRIISIMELMGLSDHVETVRAECRAMMRQKSGLHRAKSSFVARGEIGTEEILNEDTWPHTMTHSCLMRLHLARALIANPDVMVLERTTQHFNRDFVVEILELFRQHINERGLCLEGDVDSRMCRTVFYSTDSVAQAMKADVIIEMDPVHKTIRPRTAEAYRSHVKDRLENL